MSNIDIDQKTYFVDTKVSFYVEGANYILSQYTTFHVTPTQDAIISTYTQKNLPPGYYWVQLDFDLTSAKDTWRLITSYNT